ncbi:hypothetical protein A0R60_4073 [Enterobacter asburiae]|nr:hypothetical protein A0R60_4073 [Enterobacter asburiae]
MFITAFFIYVEASYSALSVYALIMKMRFSIKLMPDLIYISAGRNSG